jgi:hypothetical protein
LKTIFQTLFIAVAISACNTGLQSETKENGINNTLAGYSEAQTTQESDNTNQNVSRLIGKTTSEIENMGWFNCAATVIDSDESGNRYAVSKLAKSQIECGSGAGKILLVRFVSRDGNKAVYEVIDEIDIQSNYPEKEYKWTTCKINGANGEEFYVIHFKDQRQAELTGIYDLWTIDLKAGKFVKVKKPDAVSCVNPDYYDGL